jgi:hypothetical protein
MMEDFMKRWIMRGLIISGVLGISLAAAGCGRHHRRWAQDSSDRQGHQSGSVAGFQQGEQPGAAAGYQGRPSGPYARMPRFHRHHDFWQ